MVKSLSLLESVGCQLTAHAAESLRTVRRDLSKTVSSRALSGLLQERGLPTFDAALNFEAHYGGADLGWRKSTFGVYAAISAWERDAAVRLSEAVLLEEDGRRLLPIAFDEHDFESGFWIDEEGAIYYDENLEETYAFASSEVVFLERVAFLVERGRWRGPHFEDSDDTLAVRAEVGQFVAEALGIPPFTAASDAYSSTWYEPGRALIIEEVTWWRSTTITAALDVLVSAARVVSERAPDALAEWRGSGAPPKLGEPIAARLPMHVLGAGHDAAGEILFIGTPGNYRVHRFFNEQFAYLAGKS